MLYAVMGLWICLLSAEPTAVVGTLETRAHLITISRAAEGLLYSVVSKNGADTQGQSSEPLTLDQLRLKRPDVFHLMQRSIAQPTRTNRSTGLAQ